MSEFEKWFGSLLDGSERDVWRVSIKGDYKKAWKEARKGYIKLEDVLKIFENCCESDIIGDIPEEIKKLGGE